MIAVVIATYVRSHLRALLGDLARESGMIHVILVDNSGNPEPIEIPLGLPATTLKPSGNLGWLRGTNLGWAAACEMPGVSQFLLMNDDTRLSPRFVAGLEAAARSGKRVGVVAPVYDDVWPQQRVRWVGPAMLYEPADRERAVSFVDGTAMLVTPEAVRELGFLDEARFGETGWGADLDYCMQATDAGLGVLVTERSYLNHYGGSTAYRVHGSYDGKAAHEMDVGMRQKHGADWRARLGIPS